MVNRVRNILNDQTLIQATTAKITIVLFLFMIVSAISLESLFWNREVSQINNNFLTTASILDQNLQQEIPIINNMKNDPLLNKEAKLENINKLLKPILASRDYTVRGYFDLALGINFPLNIIDSVTLEQILAGNNYDLTLVENTSCHLKIPIYFNGIIQGYVWMYSNNSNILFKPFQLLTVNIIFLLVLSLIIVVLVKRYLKDLQNYLESFSKIIIESEGQSDRNTNLLMTKLPELKPVLNKIAYFTENLKHTNIELNIERTRIAGILEGITDGFLSLDNEWRCTYVNQVAKLLFSNDNILGLTLWEAWPEIAGTITEEKLDQALSGSQSIHWEAKISEQSHKYFVFHAYPFGEGLTIFFTDITELKQQQSELSRFEKLNLIGQLAAGIGHEIRNPLTTVRGFLQLISIKPKYEQEREFIELMIAEIDRANLIITDFLSLSKAKVDHAKCQNLNDIIDSLFPLLQADAFANNKEVQLNLSKTDNILLDNSEIKQLILNLVRNGLEAADKGGRVIISTRQEADMTVLMIEDNGPGIPPEIQAKLGTPFFTTKDTGTGLGLAISISIAQRHNATFEFKTDTDGTSFIIKFPSNCDCSR